MRLSRNMFMQNFMELSAAVHKSSCIQRKKTLSKTRQSVGTMRTVNRGYTVWHGNDLRRTRQKDGRLYGCLTNTRIHINGSMRIPYLYNSKKTAEPLSKINVNIVFIYSAISRIYCAKYTTILQKVQL